MRWTAISANSGTIASAANRATFVLAVLLGLLMGADLQADDLRVKLPQGKGEEVGVAVRQNGDMAYLDLNGLAQALSISVYESKERHKLQYAFGSARLSWTADNVFVAVAEKLRQLPAPVVYQDGRFWAPLEASLTALDDLYPAALEFDRAARQLSLRSSNSDVYAIQYDSKDNGTLVRLSCARKISFSQPVLKDNALSLTLEQTSIDKNILERTPASGAVEKLQVERSGRALQLTFKLTVPVVEYSAWQDEDSHQINLSIVTKVLGNDTLSDIVAAPVGEFAEIGELLEREQEKWKVDCIVIDPGHGGKDPGAIGVTGLKEKDATLDIALRLKQLIQQNTKLKVILTREDDRLVGLNERTRLANREGGKLFISIHCNSMKRGRGSGFETYFLKPARSAKAMEVAMRENSVIDYEESTNGYQDLMEENYILLAMAQSEFARESETLAEIVQNKMRLNTELKDRGVDQAGFYVLVGASMPAILVETAFLSSKREEKLLKTKKFRQQVAQALYGSVLEFMERTGTRRAEVSEQP